jgi:hypothetical protein
MPGSLLDYLAIRALLGKRDIGERDISERDIGERDIRGKNIGEWDIGEALATGRFDQQLLIHLHIQRVSGC